MFIYYFLEQQLRRKQFRRTYVSLSEPSRISPGLITGSLSQLSDVYVCWTGASVDYPGRCVTRWRRNCGLTHLKLSVAAKGLRLCFFLQRFPNYENWQTRLFEFIESFTRPIADDSGLRFSLDFIFYFAPLRTRWGCLSSKKLILFYLSFKQGYKDETVFWFF